MNGHLRHTKKQSFGILQKISNYNLRMSLKVQVKSIGLHVVIVGMIFIVHLIVLLAVAGVHIVQTHLKNYVMILIANIV